MKKINIELTGTTPLLMHRFPLEPIKGIEKEDKEIQAAVSAYRFPKEHPLAGELYIPADNVKQSTIAGAAAGKVKEGKATIGKLIASGFFISDERIPLGTSTYSIDGRSVVIPSTGGRIVRYRPRLDEWVLKFTCEFEDEASFLKPDQIKQCLDAAGKFVGIGDYRPQCKGPFGKFTVTLFQLQK